MKQYLSIGKQWGLRIGIFFLILFLLLDLGIIFVLAEMNAYMLTAEEVRLYTYQSITQSKCYDMMREWERSNDYGVSEYSLSPDWRGKTHFKFVIEDPDGETLYSTLSDQTDAHSLLETAAEHVLPVYEHTHTENGFTCTDRYVYYGSKIDNQDTHLFTVRGYYGYDSETFDAYDLTDLLVDFMYPARYVLPAVLLLGIIALLIL